MIIRKIRPEELKRTQELFAVAFEFSADLDKSPMEVFEEISQNPKSREDACWADRWAAFEDDDHTMMSYFITQPFPVHFDGAAYKMTGIGGVATLPQYRKSGGIRGCFEKALPDMYQNGFAFSYLYPFSTAYYRKFGYEMGCNRISYHVKLASLKHYPVDGRCILVEQGNLMLPEIKQIYGIWQQKYNMMIVNEDWEFAWVEKANPVKDQVFTYVYLAADDTPKGYITLKQSMEPDGRNISCSRFCAVDAEGIKGLLNVLIALGSDHTFATFDLPTDIDISMILPEWAMYSVETKIINAGMVRVVNVEKVLWGARYRGTGSLTLNITDDQIEENNGQFFVSFEDGKAVSVEKVVRPYTDVTLDINSFSRLIIGTQDVNALEYMDNVIVHGDLNEIGKVFYKKPTMIMEYF